MAQVKRCEPLDEEELKRLCQCVRAPSATMPLRAAACHQLPITRHGSHLDAVVCAWGYAVRAGSSVAVRPAADLRHQPVCCARWVHGYCFLQK